MKKIVVITSSILIGSLNVFAAWNTVKEFTGNFGKDKKRVETETQKFRAQLDAYSYESVASNK